MPESVDPVTGEVISSIPPRMPPEIAGAIIRVMRGAKQLGFDERNQHGGYSYASIDKFLSAFNPLLADAGLLLLIEELRVEYRDGAVNDKGRTTQWAMPHYEIWLAHESGAMWGPLHRHLALPMTGPQTFGAAESYVQKRLLRGLFMVPTGEKDADETSPSEMPAAHHRATKASPVIAQAGPGEDRARDAYKRLAAAEKNAEDSRALLEIYDPVLSEWGPSEDVGQIMMGGPAAAKALEALRSKIVARLAETEIPIAGAAYASA